MGRKVFSGSTDKIGVMASEPISSNYRRRMELEDKAKVFAAVWGAKFVQFLAALAVLPRSI